MKNKDDEFQELKLPWTVSPCLYEVSDARDVNYAVDDDQYLEPLLHIVE